MPERITKNRRDEFLKHLKDFGGATGNSSLRNKLDWDDEFYWRVQETLIKDGHIVPGPGRGGSVRLTIAESEDDISTRTDNGISTTNGGQTITARRPSERSFYESIKITIESTWSKRFAFDEIRVEETHSRGSKQTGGTFTRPDLTVAGVKRYVFLPKRLEIITFEIKPPDSAGIMGVLEAIAHREAAHRSYVIYILGRSKFEILPEAERIIELAQKYEIGVLLTEDPSNVESWEILIDAIRHEPDPTRLDRFLGDLPGDALKKQLHKWIT